MSCQAGTGVLERGSMMAARGYSECNGGAVGFRIASNDSDLIFVVVKNSWRVMSLSKCLPFRIHFTINQPRKVHHVHFGYLLHIECFSVPLPQ